MLFSVIIPTYNRLSYLPYMLESVWAQSFADFEIIIIDDGSTDGTLDYLATLGVQVQVISQMNRGPGAARNAGAMCASGEYLAFLDSDDLWFPWALAVYSEIISKQDNPAMIAGCVLEFSRLEELSERIEHDHKFDVFEDYFAASKSGFHVGAGMGVYRANAFRCVGGFVDQNINCEDHDLALRLGDAGEFVQVRAPFTLAYRQHTKSMTRDPLKTISGVTYLIQQECSGAYPGQDLMAHVRWEIITRHIRPVSMMCLKNKLGEEGWKLYCESFRWHVALGRWKYLLGFAFFWLLSCFGKGHK